MKFILIPLITFLMATTFSQSVHAALCEQCSGKIFIASIGQCKVCADGVTTSGAFKLCKKCSAKLAQCESCRQEVKSKPDTEPVTKNPPAKEKNYPAHWGAPPTVQTKDLRPLPGGYGMGSGTLAKWIQKNLDQDAKQKPGVDQEKAGAANAEEIKRLEKQIADKEEFATRARFTQEGLEKHQKELAALRQQLKELKGETKPQ